MDAADKLLAAGSETRTGVDWGAVTGDSTVILEDVQAMIAKLHDDVAFGPYVLYMPLSYLGTDRRIARRYARRWVGRFRKSGSKRGYVLTRWKQA